MSDEQSLLSRLEAEIERRLLERFAALRDEFDRLRLETDRRWAGFLERFDQSFGGIVPAEMLESSGVGAAPLGAVGIEDARTLDTAADQVETLHRFLELCRKRASRTALLVSKGGSLGVWKAVGFSDHGLDDEAVRKLAIPVSGGPLSAVLEGAPLSLSRGNAVSARLEASDATEAIVIPMVVKEKVSGAVYADAVPGEEGRFDPNAIALLTFLAGLAVDRLATRRLRPSPALKPLPDRAHGEEDVSDLGIPRPRELPLATPPPPPPPAPPARKAESTHIDFESSSPSPAAPLPVPPVPVPLPELAPPAPAPRDVSPAATVQMPEIEIEPDREWERPPEVSKPAPPPVAPPPSPPPAPAPRRLGGPLARVEDTDERKEEARRFAKLLVSEIKLYNERAVQEGRDKGNLYERLKDDIDRSRQMYDERIPEDIRTTTNFFYEELVRTLADGRAEALGL